MAENQDSQNADGESAEDGLLTSLGLAYEAMAGSPLHAGRSLKELHEKVLPPLALGQFRAFQDKDGKTLGFVSWAMVSRDVLKKLESPSYMLKLSEWQCGDVGVVMEIVALSPASPNRLLRQIKSELFADSLLMALRLDAEKKEPVMAEVENTPPGRGVSES